MRDRIAIAALAVYMWAIRSSLGADRSDTRLVAVIVSHLVRWAGQRDITVTVSSHWSTTVDTEAPRA